MKILKPPTVERHGNDIVILLNIPLTDAEEAEKFCSTIKEGEYRLSASKVRQKRSLNANAYLWTMCEMIAQKMGISKTEVYRQAIREVGVYHDMAVMAKDIEEVTRVWEANGIGWFVERFDSRLPECVRVRCYHGSSLYNTQEMSRLVDYVNEEAHALGIETEIDENLRLMMEHWNE